MKFPKNILVVISGNKKKHEALERALGFMKFADVNIHIFNVIYEPIMEVPGLFSSELREEMKDQFIAERKSYINKIAKNLEKKGIKCKVQVTWHPEVRKAIEIATEELKPDLVIKRISAESTNINPFAMPIDSHLLRYCAAPLLLVQQAHWSRGPILAAIDPFAKDAQHVKLNSKIFETSKMLMQVTSNFMHPVSCYIVPPLSPSIGVLGFDYENIKSNSKRCCEERLESILVADNVKKHDMKVIDGPAEQGIPSLVKQLSASLVVLGTVGRKGIAATFLGNTAEQVLAELNCDVLVLKPN